LVANAVVHRIGADAAGKREYILIPHGLDLELALKVDKLHLGRIYADNNCIYGAKVVQRTLGTHQDVCGKLLAAALEDASSSSSSQKEPIYALASLQGLSKWVEKEIVQEEEQQESNGNDPTTHYYQSTIINQLKGTDEASFEAVKAIATGKPRPGHSVVGEGTYRDGEEGWKQLATEFTQLGLSSEADLYLSNGAYLDGIAHLADTSREGLLDAGGAMARLKFDL